MDLYPQCTVPADRITALFIQGRMIELDTVCTRCVCVSVYVLLLR